ncbi:glycoside hydrolase family 15 protein [Streptomyces sp. NPDC057271]|uniref:glycoside hydrolase family 15 protein n=1 Tax=unclassified Streptomyces TaxID=2593676 RepID=UPI003638AB7F
MWEVRSPTRPFTYSAAMCQVALDRAARLSRRLGLPGDPRAWERDAEAIRSRVLTDAWDPSIPALTGHLGPGGGLDASLLALPLRRVLPADHPRIVVTCQAVAERLAAGGGLLYRYLPEESPDGIGGPEGGVRPVRLPARGQPGRPRPSHRTPGSQPCGADLFSRTPRTRGPRPPTGSLHARVVRVIREGRRRTVFPAGKGVVAMYPHPEERLTPGNGQ